MLKLNLRRKYILLISCLVLLVVTILTLIVNDMQRKSLLQSMKDHGRLMSELMAKSSAEVAMAGNFTELEKDIERIAKKKDVVYVLMLDKEGKVSISSLNPKTNKPLYPTGYKFKDKAGRKAARTRQTLVQTTHFQGKPVIDISAEMIKYGKRWGVVRIGLSLSSVSQAISKTTKRVLLFALLAIALGMLFSVFLAEKIVKPIHRLAEGTKKIAGGNLTAKVEINTGDELQVLGESFNQMAINLKSSRDKMEQQMEEIRQKNRETETIYTVVKSISATIEKENLMKSMLEVLVRMLEAKDCSVFVLNERKEVIEVFKIKEEIYDFSEIKASELGINDFSDFHDFSSLPNLNLKGAQSLVTPLYYKNQEVGRIAISRDKDMPFSQNDTNLLTAIGHHLTIALENARLYEEAIKDGLTSLYIKRYFFMRLKEEVRRYLRYGLPFSVIMLDIDHFKKVNDTYGHLVGDEILKGLAKLILRRVRTTDIPARFGGEEFIIILVGQEKENAFKVAETLRKRVEEHKFPVSLEDKPHLSITISLGVSSCPEDSKDDEALVKIADDALYQAKKGGRNKVCLSST